MRRRHASRALLAAGVLLVGLVPLAASASAERLTQTVADGSAVAFTLSPSYDEGGADPLKLYVGYTEANVSTPDPEADGQASWYNLAILETGLFLPPEQCTPEKNLQATLDGAADLSAWLSDTVTAAVDALQQGQAPGTPTLPGPRHACTERFPGFAQSRYPATTTIPVQQTDDYLDKPTAAQACRQDPASSQCAAYTQYWPVLHGAARAALQDGSFATSSTDAPSQRSEAVLLGAGDGTVVSVGTARTSSSARLVDGALVMEASSTMDDVCLAATGAGCALRIDHLVQRARLVQRAGHPAERSSGTVVTGVHGTGLSQDLDAQSLQLGAVDVDLGGYLHLAAASRTGSCGPTPRDPAEALVDTGGLLLTAKQGTAGQGGGILLGGACVRARLAQTSFDLGEPPTAPVVPPTVGAPTALPVAAPLPSVGPGPGTRPAVVAAPRTVVRSVTHYVEEAPLAWRTARYWVPLLGLVALLALACRLAPRHPLVAPVAGAADRFARRFLRG